MDRKNVITLDTLKGFLDGHVVRLSEELRQNQYLADVAQENAERQTRSETALDPNAPATRERWNAGQGE